MAGMIGINLSEEVIGIHAGLEIVAVRPYYDVFNESRLIYWGCLHVGTVTGAWSNTYQKIWSAPGSPRRPSILTAALELIEAAE